MEMTMKLQAHQIETSDLEMAMFQNNISTIRAKRKAWQDAGPRAHEKHAALARAAERARKLRQSWGEDA